MEDPRGPGAEAQVHRFEAEPLAGRLDRYVAGLGLPLSRSQIQKLIDAGLVTVDGKRARASLRLHGGEDIELRVPRPQQATVAAQDIPVELVYEDRWLAVVNKPRGLVVHPGPGHPSGTLVNALLHRCPDLSGIGGVLRPGIVHRLDKDTSGLLVVAKDDVTHRALQAQFQGRDVRKTYLAVVLGRLEGEGRIDLPVGRHPTDRKRMAANAPRAKAAVTCWRACQQLAGATLLEIRLETGRTHQIRVHLGSIGHPVVGDPLYGGVRRARGIADAQTRHRLARERGQALHAWKLGFRHPQTDAALTLQAPPPQELLALVRDLGGEPP